jgi:hypothetical protein
MERELRVARLLHRVDLRPQVVGAQKVIGDPQTAAGISL